MTRTFGRTAMRAVRRLDHLVGRHRTRRRVLVDVRTPMNLAVLRPMWIRMLADPRLDVSFTAEPDTGVDAQLTREGLSTAMMSRREAAWTRFDLAMTADLWNDTPLKRCRRRINFFHGVAGKYDLDDPNALKSTAGLDRFDRLAFINRDRLERYVASGAIQASQAVLVGFPKMDDLVNGTWPAAETRTALGLSPSIPTVLFAPTFSAANALHVAGEEIITTLLAAGHNVIVKLHDRSMIPHPKYTNGVDWPARLATFERHSRFVLSRGADAGPLLAAADLLVTDHSTVGFEFALLDRPIVVYDAPELRSAARIDLAKWELLRSMAEIVSTTEELRRAVDAELANPARRRRARLNAHELFAHAGTATERAMHVLYELLDLEPAAVVSGNRRRAADDESRRHLGDVGVA